MSEPSVSVVMPVWRPEPDQLRAAVASVLQQTWGDLELIVVEDPSDRPGTETVLGFADPRVRYVLNEQRTSIVQQHNLAVSLARSALIARFDADDLCEGERIQLQKAFLESHPSIGVVGCQMLVMDHSGAIVGERRYPVPPAAIRSAFPRFNPIPNPGVMFRRELVERHGGWTEGSNGVARDYEWFSRLAAAGVLFENLDRPLVRYRLHDASLKRRKLRATLQTTWEVKRDYWRGEMGAFEAALMYGERLLGYLPAPVVIRLFRTIRIRPA